MNKVQIKSFLDSLFETPPYNNMESKEDLKTILQDTLEKLYLEIPQDVINFLNGNDSDNFMYILYREAGINDYYINTIPDSMKTRLSYLIHQLNLRKATDAVFPLMHEALEEFYPKLNVYKIIIVAEDQKPSVPFHKLKFVLEPIYITDEENIQTEISKANISTSFLAQIEQFIDRGEKFSNMFPDEKSKRRTINVFPIDTGIIHIQNPNGVGVDDDQLDTLMNMLGASKQQFLLFPWRTNPDTQQRRLMPLRDFIKLCTYLKYKEFEFKAKRNGKTYRWSTKPLSVYRDQNMMSQWESAQRHSINNAVNLNNFFNLDVGAKLNNWIVDDEDVKEVETLLDDYKGLKRSQMNDGYERHTKFRLDFNTLRRKAKNQSYRRPSNIDEFRAELVGTDIKTINQFQIFLLLSMIPDNPVGLNNELIILQDIKELLGIYDFKLPSSFDEGPDASYQPNIIAGETNQNAGILHLLKSYRYNNYLQAFLDWKENKDQTQTQSLEHPNKELDFYLDLFQWYLESGKYPLLTKFRITLFQKFRITLGGERITRRDPNVNSFLQLERLLNELNNDANIGVFTGVLHKLNSTNDKYSKEVEEIDNMLLDPTTEPEDFTVMFLTLWKTIQAETQNTRFLKLIAKTQEGYINERVNQAIRFFWNSFFSRLTLGDTYKEFFFDPIINLFLEYWLPAESSIQNRDIQAIRVNDKLNTIFTHSSKRIGVTSRHASTIDFWDQQKLTVFKSYPDEPDAMVQHHFIDDRLPPGYSEIPENRNLERTHFPEPEETPTEETPTEEPPAT